MTHSSTAMRAIVRLVTAVYHWRGIQPVNDPVCGMAVDPRTAKRSAEYQGDTYYSVPQPAERPFWLTHKGCSSRRVTRPQCIAHRRRQT